MLYIFICLLREIILKVFFKEFPVSTESNPTAERINEYSSVQGQKGKWKQIFGALQRFYN